MSETLALEAAPPPSPDARDGATSTVAPPEADNTLCGLKPKGKRDCDTVEIGQGGEDSMGVHVDVRDESSLGTNGPPLPSPTSSTSVFNRVRGNINGDAGGTDGDSDGGEVECWLPSVPTTVETDPTEDFMGLASFMPTNDAEPSANHVTMSPSSITLILSIAENKSNSSYSSTTTHPTLLRDGSTSSQYMWDSYAPLAVGTARKLVVSSGASTASLHVLIEKWVSGLYVQSSPYACTSLQDDKIGADLPVVPYRLRAEPPYTSNEVPNDSNMTLWEAGLQEGTKIWVHFGSRNVASAPTTTVSSTAGVYTAGTGTPVRSLLENVDRARIEPISASLLKVSLDGGTDGKGMDTSPMNSPTKAPLPVDETDEELSLFNCLDKFVEREEMEEADFYCTQCKEHLAPIKKLDIWSVPDVLILHLKRFTFHRATTTYSSTPFIHREKINDMITFPTRDLDLTDYVRGPTSEEAPPVYDLYGVSEHYGGMGGGHYTAKCQNPDDEKWYSFNDSSVHVSSADAAVTQSAYVLFYKRRKGTSRPLGLAD